MTDLRTAAEIESLLIDAGEMAGDDYQDQSYNQLWDAIRITMAEIKARDVALAELKTERAKLPTTPDDFVTRGMMSAVANSMKRDELARVVCEAAQVFVANAGKAEHAHGRTSFTGSEYAALLAAIEAWKARP